MTAVGEHRMPVEALAAAAAEIARSSDLRSALAAVAAAAVEATGAELVVLRVIGDDGELVARAVAPETSPLAPEVTGTRASCDDLAAGTASGAVTRAAEHAHAGETVVEAARSGERVIGSVEAIGRRPFSEAERAA
ncbi:MAG TPA: hypothetical protein VHC01_09170, partial [Gaiellaceae bacterium]|nr:hypothetical protein [Gaiellaceae bacterium]